MMKWSISLSEDLEEGVVEGFWAIIHVDDDDLRILLAVVKCNGLALAAFVFSPFVVG